MSGIRFRIHYDTPSEVSALAIYPLLQDNTKAYPHFEITSGFIVVINPYEEDVENKGVIIPCVKKGRWYFKGGDYFRDSCAVAWHESEDDASHPHTEGVYSVSRHDDNKIRGYDTQHRKKYAEMIDIYTKQKCLIHQIAEKGNIPSHLCGYITQFVVYHPDDKRYFTWGCTEDGWYAHTGTVFVYPTAFTQDPECGLFDAKKFRDYSKLPVENLMSVMNFESRFKQEVARDLWHETIRHTSNYEHPVSLPNGMCVESDQGTESIEVRYNDDEECVGVRFFVEEDSDCEEYSTGNGSD